MGLVTSLSLFPLSAASTSAAGNAVASLHQTLQSVLASEGALEGELTARALTEIRGLEESGILPRQLGDFRKNLEGGTATREHVERLSQILSGLMESAASLDAQTAASTSLLLKRPPELRLVTVLFTDFTGYTEASKTMPPDEAIALLNRYFEMFENLVLSAGGTVDKWIGDAMMAFWGAPVSRENDTFRAVQTALLLQRATDAVNRRLEETGGKGFGLKIGLHRGEAVAGFVGGSQTAQYTLIGQTVNVAARTEPMATSGQVIVTDAVHREIDRFFGTKSAGQLLGKKGRTHEVDALPLYEILTEKTGFSPNELRGDLLPLIGRDREMAAVEAFFDQADKAGFLFVEAPAGVGKTRLADEFRSRLRARVTAVRVVDGNGDSLALEEPYRAVGSVLKNLLRGLDLSNEPSVVVDRLKTELGIAGNLSEDRLEQYAYVLAHLLGVRLTKLPSELVYLFHDAALLKDVRTDAVVAVLSAAMDFGVQPLVLILEDMHWFDRPSLDLLRAAIERLSSYPLGILGLGRPEFARNHPSYFPISESEIDSRKSVVLAPLEPEALGRMIDILVERSESPNAADAMDPETRDLLIQAFGGNTYLFRSMAQAVLEGWKLGRNAVSGEIECAAPGQAAARPAQYFLQSLIDTLSPETRRALREISVLGSEFSEDEARAIGLKGLERALDEMKERDFIVSFGDGRHCFQNTLVRDVAYGQLIREEQRALHRRIAVWMESAEPSQAARIAHHYERAGLPAEASAHYARAAEAALRGAEYRAASAFAEKAYALAGDPNRRADALLTWDESLFARRDPSHADLLPRFEETLGDPSFTDPPRRGEMHRRRGLLFVSQNRSEEALAEVRAGLGALKDGEPRHAAAKSRLMNLLGNIHWNASDYPAALAAYEASLSVARLGRDDNAVAIVQTNLCTLYGILGDYGRALEAGEDAVRLRRGGDNRRSLVQLLNNFGSLIMSLGDHERALSIFDEALRTSETELKGFHRFYLLPNRGEALRLLGRSAEAAAFLKDTLSVHDGQRGHFMAGVHLVYLALALEDARDSQGAASAAAEALQIARESNNIALEAMALFAGNLVSTDEDGLEIRARRLETSTLAVQRLDEAGYIPEFDLSILLNHTRQQMWNNRPAEALETIVRALEIMERRAATIPAAGLRDRYRSVETQREIVRIHDILSRSRMPAD